jgi:phosphatidylglycerophosphate synthase
MQREFFSESSLYKVHYNLYQPIVISIAPTFKRLNITPNQITLARIPIIICIALLLLYLKYKLDSTTSIRTGICVFIACTLILLCGLLDDLDGYMARKYNMKSNIGAKLDFAVDFIMFTVMMAIAYIYVGANKFITIIFPIGILIMFYKKWENSMQLELPVLNVISHIFVAYIILVIAIVYYM